MRRKLIVTIRTLSLCLAFMILGNSVSFAQYKAGIKGHIYELKTNKPVSDVNIAIKIIGKGCVSTNSGSYSLDGLDAGKYTLAITHVGYVNQNKKVTLKEGQILELNIYLDEEVTDLPYLEVKDELIKQVPYIRHEVFKADIEQSAARDAAEYLRSIPNVSAIRKGGTNLDPVIRGFKFSQLNIQADNGMKIEGGCPNRMDPASSHIEMEDIESIEVYKGPFALRYGPSFGGVINLKTIKPKPYETFEIHAKALKGYETNWNGNKEHISIMGGNKKIFFNLSGSNKEYGKYTDGNGNLVNSQSRKFNYKAQVGFKPYKNHVLYLSYEEAKTRDVGFPALPMDERSDDTRLMSLDYAISNLTKTISSVTFKLYNSDVDHVMDLKERPFSDTVVAISSLNAVNTGYRLEFGLNFGEDHLFIGTDYENITKDGDREKNMIMQPQLPVLPNKVEQLWNNALIKNYGIFAEYRTKKAGLDFIIAARADINSGKSDEIVIMHPMQGEIYKYGVDSIESDFTNISFSVGATKHLNENFSVSLALGRGTRSPDMVERYIILLPVGFDKYDYLGDPQLKPETNNEVDLTLKYENEKFGAIELNGFYSIVNDYITGERLPPSQQKPLSLGVLGVKQFYNADKVTFSGFELAFATPEKHKLGVRLIAAYTKATIATTTKYIMDQTGAVVDEEEINDDPLNEIPPMEAAATVQYKMFKGKLTPRVSLRIVSKQSNVSVSFNEDETPGFTVADFGLVYKHNSIFTVSGGVNNIFDTAYYEHLNRRIIGGKANLYEPGRIFYVNLIFSI